MPPLTTLGPAHRKLLQLVFEKFSAHGEWPTARSVRLAVRQEGELSELCQELGHTLIVCSSGNSGAGTCELRLHALLHVQGAHHDKTLVIKAIEYLLKRYIDEIESKEKVEVSTVDFETAVGFTEVDARRVTKWLYYAPMISSSFAPDMPKTRGMIGLSDDILRLEGVATFEEYLERVDSLEEQRFHRVAEQREKVKSAFAGRAARVSTRKSPNAPSVGKRKLPTELRTALNRYEVLGPVGQGGAGFVVKVRDESGGEFAAKILNPVLTTTERRKRFQNELRFCLRNEHPNIVQVTDFGSVTIGGAEAPFYIMPLYDGTLRDIIRQLPATNRILPMFAQILDGVEAAHLRHIAHRDLKPENILYHKSNDRLVVGDFGIAGFTQEELYTAVETGPESRLANFQYAAPEQRARGQSVDHRADIYALGLMLNELFTGNVPQGTDFVTIGSRAPEYAYLDAIVNRMVRQDPVGRFQTVDDVKSSLIAEKQLFVGRQKVDALTKQVIPESEVDDSLVREPPAVKTIDYEPGVLIVVLTRVPTSEWITTFHEITGVSFHMGHGPRSVRFEADHALIRTDENTATVHRSLFGQWLARANEEYRSLKTQQQANRIVEERAALAQRLAREQERQRVLRKLNP